MCHYDMIDGDFPVPVPIMCSACNLDYADPMGHRADAGIPDK